MEVVVWVIEEAVRGLAGRVKAQLAPDAPEAQGGPHEPDIPKGLAQRIREVGQSECLREAWCQRKRFRHELHARLCVAAVSRALALNDTLGGQIGVLAIIGGYAGEDIHPSDAAAIDETVARTHPALVDNIHIMESRVIVSRFTLRDLQPTTYSIPVVRVRNAGRNSHAIIA